MNHLHLIGLFIVCTTATAGAQSKMYPTKGGVTLHARAYTDYSDVSKYGLKYASRYDLSIAKTSDGTKWDFTLDDEPKYHYTGGISTWYPTTYNNKPTATLRATLHQYETYEERVAFKDLVVVSSSSSDRENFPTAKLARYLEVSEPQTFVTSSGLRVTLPIQNEQSTPNATMGSFLGNDPVLYLKINVSPDQREVTLPDSPLYKKYGKPVTIQLGTSVPNSMVWYEADNTFKTFAIGLPNLKTLKHLDSLTLILRQRVELQTIPVAIEVPIERPAKGK